MITATSDTVTLKDGTKAKLDRSLIAPMHRPAGGWSVRMRINGVDRTFTGRTPQETAGEVMKDFRRNNIPVSVSDLWLNLNLQWYERIDPRFHQALLVELTQIVKEVPDASGPVSEKKSVLPEFWGSIAWKWLGLFLAQDNYDPRLFLTELDRVLAMMNPASCPTLGCSVCYTHFSAELQTIRLRMPKTREDARRWIFSFHNRVNNRLAKPEISYETAARLNFWN